MFKNININLLKILSRSGNNEFIDVESCKHFVHVLKSLLTDGLFLKANSDNFMNLVRSNIENATTVWNESTRRQLKIYLESELFQIKF